MNQSIALLLSLIIEVPIAWWWLRSIAPRRTVETIVIAICATVLTHPWVWLFNYLLIPVFSFPLRVLILEAGAIIIEAIVYRLCFDLTQKSAFSLATIANITSFSLGLIIMEIWY